MALPETLQVALRVARVLEDLRVPYLVGGSLASSLHGIPRSTQDADLVADLRPEHVVPLVAALKDTFYIDAERAGDAIRGRSSFNVIHLATMTKVDLFVLKDDELSRLEMERRQEVALTEEPGTVLPVASAEDTVLQKLAWFRMGGGVSERQWNDVLGVLKVKRGRLDLIYLGDWAERTGLDGLLRQALGEAGLEV